MSSVFKVGISGGGTIGQVHANALSTVRNAKLVAIAEPRADAGKSFAEEHGARWYRSLSEMLDQADVDVVIVATPSGLHPEQVARVARAGKHVITEKPMAISSEAASEMIAACENAGVKLAVVFQNRLSADVMRVRRAILKGYLGTPVLASGEMYWYRSDEYYAANEGWRGTWALDGGGALMNQAIHTVDLLQWLMGGVISIQAHTATLTHAIETEDVASASFRYANGALGSITATTSARKDYPVRIEIVGTAGRVTLENNTIVRWDADHPADDSLLTDEDRKLVEGWQANEPFGAGHARQLKAIFDYLAEGSQPPISGTEARTAVDVILGIYDSARTGTRTIR